MNKEPGADQQQSCERYLPDDQHGSDAIPRRDTISPPRRVKQAEAPGATDLPEWREPESDTRQHCQTERESEDVEIHRDVFDTWHEIQQHPPRGIDDRRGQQHAENRTR